MREALLDVKELSGLLRVHPKTVYEWKSSGKLPSVTVNGRVRFERGRLDEFIERHRSGLADPSPLSAKIVIDLDNFDRMYLRLTPKGGSAVKEKTRRRWNYGFGSIYLRKTKEGTDRWAIDYQDRGKRVREVVRDARTRGEAVVALQAKVAESFNGRLNPTRKAEPMKFARLADIYLDEYAKANKKSWRCDEISLRANLVPYFGDMRLEDVTPLVVEKYRTARLRTVRKSSTNREMALLKLMFRLAIDWGFASANPIRKVKLFSEKDNLKERILTDEEEVRLLAAASDDLRPVLITLLNTGGRRMEVLSLRWRDIDLERGTVVFTKTKAGRNRMVPVNEPLREVLSALKRKRADDYVFPDPTGDRLNGVRRSFEKACRRAGLEGLRLHDLRHTFATRLIRRGVDIITVQALLGHSSVAVTQRYIHTGEDAKREAVRRLEPESLARPWHAEKTEGAPPPANHAFSVN